MSVTVTGFNISGNKAQSALVSTAIENAGSLTLVRNVIDGGISTSWSRGVISVAGSTLNASFNRISGGQSTTRDTAGLENSGTGIVVNNLIEGGTAADTSIGVYNDCVAGVQYINNTIVGGSADMNSFGIRNRCDVASTWSNNQISGGEAVSGVSVSILSATSGSLTLENNNLFGSADGFVRYYQNGSWRIESDINLVNSCTNWAEGRGCVVATNESISEDPLFSDVANGDFSLLQSSPNIDKGLDKSHVTQDSSQDITGANRVNNPDIGAYEYLGGI